MRIAFGISSESNWTNPRPNSFDEWKFPINYNSVESVKAFFSYFSGDFETSPNYFPSPPSTPAMLCKHHLYFIDWKRKARKKRAESKIFQPASIEGAGRKPIKLSPQNALPPLWNGWRGKKVINLGSLALESLSRSLVQFMVLWNLHFFKLRGLFYVRLY